MNGEKSHRELFIQSMRSVANSVAVITTDGQAGRHGATVSSFCSVSADPPTMLVCLHDNSRIADCVKKNEHFCINVLPQDMEDVANRFAGQQDGTMTDRFDGIDQTPGIDGCPAIAGSISFHCRLDTQHVSGSHRVVIGEINQIQGVIERPLTYLDGTYHPWQT